MYVSLLFDVEDLLTPEADTIARQMAEVLSAEGLRGTFMVVGQKARLLRERGRKDVIRALKAHDIGLHSDMHSVHPTVCEYLAGKGWEDGLEEVRRREGRGLRAIEEVFERKASAWGGPGNTWGPQVAGTLRSMGAPAYVYANTRTALRGPHWFCGVLAYPGGIGGLDAVYADTGAFEAKWERVRSELLARAESGQVWTELFCGHPTMLRAQRFWDMPYYRGRNPSPSAVKPPPLRSPGEVKRALRNFRRLVRAVQGLPGITVKTVEEMNEILGRRREWASAKVMVTHARGALARREVVVGNDFSPAQMLLAWLQVAMAYDATGKMPGRVKVGEALGPTDAPNRRPCARPSSPGLRRLPRLPWKNFASLCCTLRQHVKATGALPSETRAWNLRLGPGHLYAALAEAYLGLRSGKRPRSVAFQDFPQVPAVAEVNMRELAKMTGWVVHPPDLDISRIVALAGWQTWTLRDAMP